MTRQYFEIDLLFLNKSVIVYNLYWFEVVGLGACLSPKHTDDFIQPGLALL